MDALPAGGDFPSGGGCEIGGARRGEAAARSVLLSLSQSPAHALTPNTPIADAHDAQEVTAMVRQAIVRPHSDRAC